MTFDNVITLIRSGANENENYYYDIFLEKYSYKDKSNKEYFQMNVCVSQMLYFDGIDVSEGNDVNKTSALKECHVRYYWYFLNYSFKFQLNVCHRCHDFLMMSLNLRDILILKIKGSNYLL